MLGSPNPRRGNAPLAMRLKIALHAPHAVPDRHGLPSLSSAMTDGVRALRDALGFNED